MICENCVKFKVFKDGCHFYFDNKKECSQFEEHVEKDDLADMLRE